MTAPSPPVAVAGGIGSIAVDPDGLGAAAAIFARLAGPVHDVAGATRAAGWQLWTVPPPAAAPVAAALLGEAQQRLGSLAPALDAAAAELRTISTQLRRAARAYAHTDAGLFGHLAELAGSALHALSPAWTALARLPESFALAVAAGATDRSYRAALTTLVTHDPQLADLAGLASGLSAPAGLELLTAALAVAYPDGRPVVTPAGRDRAPAAVTAPRTLAQLLAGTTWRDEHEDDTTRSAGGEIDVKILAHPDGSRSVIVDLPGTKDWGWPGRDPDVTNLATNLRAIEGIPTSYERGVLAAMARAGVRPDDRVLIVGHSLGGMVAVDAARAAVRSGRFDVTDVLTAGSPIARTVGRLPASVQVLALENSRDVVPELDRRPNPSRPSVTTVTGEVQTGTVGGNHGLASSYETIARRAQASGAPSVRYFLADAAEFLDADAVRTERYVITRGY